jgi:hypothetical protein
MRLVNAASALFSKRSRPVDDLPVAPGTETVEAERAAL